MNTIRAILLACMSAAVCLAATGDTRLMRYPDIWRDQVVFSYAGDLWIATTSGGPARRLTAHPGDEIFPKFSPDGKWIAFTGEYDGNSDVYVIPSTGGEPRRLTFHPGADLVLGWSPDGKKVLFRSNRVSQPPDYTRLFLVPLEGGNAEMLPVPRASLTTFSPDGQRIAYNDTSQDFRTWKRYRGGWTNYINIYDLKRNVHEALPRSGAMDMFPMWHGNAIYFISDRSGGVMNLFRYDLGTKQSAKLTDYKDFDVKWPSLGPDAIVYENGGLLYAYDFKDSKTRNIPVNVTTDATYSRAEIRTVANRIGNFSLSPTGVRVLFEAHGEVFTLPAEHGSARNLTDSPGVHELDPVWSPDGKWIAYLSDRTGEYEIYLRPQKGGEETRITTDGDCYRYLAGWSPDSKKLAYTDKKLRVWYVDIQDKKPVLVDASEYRTNPQPEWSSDSRWLTYVKALINGNRTIELYSLEQKTITQVTDGFYDDWRPVFDPGGKYIYFLSDRFFYPTGSRQDVLFAYYNMTGIFAVTLTANEASPFGPQSDEEKDADEKKADDKKDEKPAAPAAAADKKPDEKKTEEKETKKPEVKPIQVDLQGIGHRISQVPLPAGVYGRLEARKDKIFYISQPMEVFQAGTPGPQQPTGTLHLYDVKKREDKVLLTAVNNFALDKEGAKLLYRAGETFGVVDAQPGKKVGDGRVNTAGLQTIVDPKEEWKQIFHEAWRIERDFYWDPGMGGLDWNMIGKRYEALLPWVAHRSDLNYIIGEMIAELNTSHTYVGGGETPDRRRIPVGMLGADLEPDGGFFRIKKIFAGENWNNSTRSPLTEPGLKVKEGNYLIAVNGLTAKSTLEPFAYFQNLAEKVVALKINDKPSEQGAWEITVRPIANEGSLRYFDWVESNRRKVAEATGGRAGYMHVPDTSIDGLIMFDKYFSGQAGKEALIVDERYNHGGMIPSFYTEKLSRSLLTMVSSREGKDTPWPPLLVTGPKVMLVNEQAGSGGDCFPWFFKREKIGPIVGTRTWGGLVGISRQVPLMDGGFVTAPEFGFYSTDNGGEWIVENHGVDPDYVVEQRPDLVVSGHDPQLEKAIELVKEGLKNTKPIPARPKYPKKTWAAGGGK